MAVSVKVVYEDGILRPLEPVKLPESQELQATIDLLDGDESKIHVDWTEIFGYDPDSEEGEARRREDWIEIFGFDPRDPENCDKRQALVEKQRQALLNFLDTMKEISSSGLSDVSENIDKYLYRKDW